MRKKAIIAVGLAVTALCSVRLLREKPQETAAGPLSMQATTSRGQEQTEDDPIQRDLITRYSEARVNLAKHTTATALELKRNTLEMGLRIAEIHRSKEGPKNSMLRSEMESPTATLRRRFGDMHGKLQLSPEQEEQAVTIQLNLFDEQALEFKEKVARLESRKDELQRLMLASDACHRKELSEEEYRSLLAATDEEMREALMPPDENRLGLVSSFSHRDFQPRFEALLDEEQKGIFLQAPVGFYLEENERREEPTANPPAMSLDNREKKLTALKKVLGVYLTMMED